MDFARGIVEYKVSPSGQEVMVKFTTRVSEFQKIAAFYPGDCFLLDAWTKQVGLIVVRPQSVTDFCREYDRLATKKERGDFVVQVAQGESVSKKARIESLLNEARNALEEVARLMKE